MCLKSISIFWRYSVKWKAGGIFMFEGLGGLEERPVKGEAPCKKSVRIVYNI